jgi:excisionase family DNA binding protein
MASARPKPVAIPPNLGTRREAAQRFRISERTLDEKIAKGEVRAFKIGARVLVDLDSLAALLRPTGGAA